MRKIAFWLLLGFVATIPLNNALRLGIGGSATKLIGIAAGFAWMVTLLTSGRVRHPGRFQIAVAGLFLWALLSLVLWSGQTGTPIESLPLLAFLVLVLWDLCETEAEIMAALQAYVVGAAAGAVSLVYNYRLGVDIQFDGTSVAARPDAQVLQRFSASGVDPNELGVMLAAAALIAGYLVIENRTSWLPLRILNIGLIPVAVFAVALTGSRTAAVAMVPALAWLVFSVRRRHRFGNLVIIAVGVAAVWSIQSYVPDLTIDRILSVSGSVSEGDFGQREIAWAEGFAMFIENPLQGVGAYAFNLNSPSDIGPHSILIQVLAELGIVGLILLTSALVLAGRAAYRMYQWTGQSIWLFLLATWAPGALTLGWTYRQFTWFLLSMVVAVAAETEVERPLRMLRSIRRRNGSSGVAGAEVARPRPAPLGRRRLSRRERSRLLRERARRLPAR